MSDTQGSTRVGMLLAIVCVAGTFIAILIIAFRSGHRHEKAIQELARAEGWSFSRISTQEHTAKVEELFPEERFTLSFIMTVESDSRNVFLLDGSYRHRASRSGGQLASVCLIESSRFRSVGARVETIAWTWTDEKLLSGQVDMGDSEFARSFVVLSRDPVSTKRTLTGRLVSFGARRSSTRS